MSLLRPAAPQDRRANQSAARIHSRQAGLCAARPVHLLLPALPRTHRDHAQAAATHRPRPGRSRPAGAGDGQQVRRLSAAVSSGADAHACRPVPGPLNLVRLADGSGHTGAAAGRAHAQDIFQSRVVQTDGTSIEVLLEGQRQTKTGYFWPYLGDEAHPHVVVDFSLDKRKEHPQRFLNAYAGYVQVDAYSAYDGCFLSNADTEHPKMEVGCWSHAERYFTAAADSDPVRAAEGLGFIHALFALEAQAKRSRLAETEVLALRQRDAVPILADFKTWLTQTQPQVLPKSPLNDALRYTLNQWEALRRYSDTGFVALDNNATERINKLIARGRVNWLFVGSPRGGETAARLLSLVVSCRRLHMDSFLYLRDVFTRLPSLPADRLDDLLPARWLQSHPEARHPPERQGHGHADPRPRRRRRSP